MALNGYGGEKAYRAAEAQRRIADRRYRSLLQRVIGGIRERIRGKKDPESIVRAVDGYANSREFNVLANSIVQRMVTGALSGLKSTWRAAAAESTKSRIIYQALREETHSGPMAAAIDEILERNSRLIHSVPPYIARRLSKFAYEETQKGKRPEEIAKEMMKKLPNLSAGRVHLIARTESAKAASAMMEARCAELGIDWYIWRSCRDERVRGRKQNAGHYAMDGVLCRWSDPPCPEALFPYTGGKPAGRYHPGGIYNCRCIAAPVVDLKYLQFPIRVHVSGKVRQVGSYRELSRIRG